MTGVGKLYGDGGVILHATATATITDLGYVSGNYGYRANVTLLAETDADGNITKLPQLTVTNVAATSTFTVKDSTGASTVAVPSGTPIFTFNGTEAQFDACKNNITITNTTATEKDLTPYFYNKEIRAEYDGVLTLKVNNAEKGNYPNFEKAFAAVEANRGNDIYINEDISVPYGKFTLPTAAQIGTGSLNIWGSTSDTTLTLNGVTSLSPRYSFVLSDLTLVPLDSSGNQLTSFTISGSKSVTMQNVTIDTATTVNVSVGAENGLNIQATSAKFGTLTGTTTSILTVTGTSITADKVTTFSTVAVSTPITVTTSMTGVGSLTGNGGVILPATATATITECGTNITLLDDAADGLKFAKPTITNVTYASTFTVKDSTGASTIPVPSGTTIFTFNGTEAQFDACKNLISIANKTATEKELTPYYYNKEIRAEYEGVLTLSVGGEEKGKYPNFEKAFAAVEANKINDIYINEDINVPYGKFTLPTAAQIGTGSLNIWGDTVTKTVTLNGVTSLSPRYTVNIDRVKLVPLDSNGKQLTSFTISGSKSVSLAAVTIDTATTVNISVGAGSDLTIEATSAKFGALTGTTTSDLYVRGSLTADKVTTFSTVGANSRITITTSMTGVGKLYGNYGGVILPATATATITTFEGGNITLRAETDTNGNITKLAKLTVTSFSNDSTFTVKDSTDYETIPVPSGTPIFTFNGTEAQFDACKDKITIANKTATDDTGKILTPYYYNKEIRAEYAGTLTLNDKDYPNFEKAFAAVEANEVNIIYINEDINVPYGKFTLPTNLGAKGSLKIEGKTGSETLTLNGVTSLSPRYSFDLFSVELVPLDRYGKQLTSFTISGSKGVSLGNLTLDTATTVNVSVGAGNTLYIYGCPGVKFGTLTGTTTSILSIGTKPITADKVTTFSTVYASAPITVTTSMTGVGELSGGVILHATATATITTLHDANITLLAETDTSGNITKLPTVTVKNASTEITVTVKDSKTGNVIAVPSGTKLLKTVSGSANYTAYLKIQNKSADNKPLNATLVGYDIVADDGDGAELQIYKPDDTPITSAIYPSLALALASVNKNAKNVIVLHKDDKLVTSYLPTGVTADFSLDIISPFDDNGDPESTFTIDLNGNTSLSASVDIMFNNVRFMSVGRYDNPVNAITIASSKDLTAFNIGLAEINTNTNVTFSVTGKDSYLGLGDIGFTPSISGSRYDYGWFESQTNMTVKDIKNISGFGPSAGTTLTVTGTVSGVTDITSGREDGKTAGVVKFAPSAAATVTNMTAANIVLEKGTDDALPKFTVTNAYKDDNVANVITVNDSTESVPSGTPVFRMACSERVFYNSGYSSNITIANKDGDKALNAFYYNGEIRAEYAGALTLFEDETEIGKYPNFTLAFKAMSAGTAAAPKNYKLFVNEDIETTTFTLPTLAANDTLTITGSGKITFKGLSAISSGFHLEFIEITLEPVKADGTDAETFNINSSASLTLDTVTIANSCNINASAGRNSTLSVKYFIGSLNELKGTTTTELDLKSSCEINKINTFATVTIFDLSIVKVNESITGVTKLTTLDSGAELRIASTATATIGTIDNVHVSLIADTSGESPVIPKLNVTTINNGSTVTVQNSGYEDLTLASGTPIFRCTDTETNFYRNSAGAFKIINKTAGDKKLDAYYYGGEIRAEVTGEPAVTLTVMTGYGDSISTDFTTLDKALNAAKKDCNNIITLKKSLEVSSIALPSGLGSGNITITADQSADTKPTLTFKGMTRLSAQCDICFENIELIFLDRSGNALNTFAISSTFELDLNSVKTATKLSLSSTGEEIYIQECEFAIGTISGNSSKTKLYISGNLTADAVNSFASVCIGVGAFTVNNTLSSVSKLWTPPNGSLVLKPTVTATIGTIRSFLEHDDLNPANIVLCAEQNEDGSIKKLATLTVSTDITSEGDVKANVFVKNEDASALIAVPSGTKIFTFSGTEQKFNEISGNMQIVNTTTGDDSTKETYEGKKLDPFYYSREIRAEYAGMLTLKYRDETTEEYVEKPFPNFEKAFAAVVANKPNNIHINEDINVPYGKFTLPTNLGTEGSLSIWGNSKKLTLNGVTSLSPRYQFTLYNLKLVPLDRNGKELTSFTISGSKNVMIENVTCGTKMNVSVGADSNLLIYNADAKFGTLSGTSTSSLEISDRAEEADTVKTFSFVDLRSPLTVNSSITGVATVEAYTNDCELILPATATATITGLGYVYKEKGYHAYVTLLAETDANGNITKLPNLTVTNIAVDSSVTVKKPVVNEDGEITGYETIAVPSGTPIFTFNGTEAQFNACNGKITITNKTATDETTGKPLTPYYYSREIRAEYEGMLTLEVDGEEKGKYPNFEKAFAAVEVNNQNIIYINEDINVSYGKFTLPTATQIGTGYLWIEGNTVTKTLTLNGVTSLSPRYYFTLQDLALVPLDRNGNKLTSFTISGSEGVKLDNVTCGTKMNVSVGAGSNLTIFDSSTAKFGTLTGTTTSNLTVIDTSITAENVKTFDQVLVDSPINVGASMTVSTSMTGVGTLIGNGDVILPATATATITNLGTSDYSANITLLAETDTNGNITKLAKPTITNVADASTFTVKKPVVNDDGEITGYETIAVPSGTPIFTFNGTEAQFDACKDNITIANKTATDESGKELTPYYYSREIRAEYEGMLTLNVDNVKKDKYPNFEKAFAAVEANKINTIVINEDINVPYGKFTLPTAAQIGTGSLFIQGNNGSKKLTLNGVTSLSPRYSFVLSNLTLVPLDRNGNELTSFTISGSKTVQMQTVTIAPATTVNVSVGADSFLGIYSTSAKFGTLTGTTTSYLNIESTSITADKITTFGTVYSNSNLTVKTSMTGVATLAGNVTLPASATATITNLGHSNIIGAIITLLAETDENGKITKLAKPTITNVAGDYTFTVKKPVVNTDGEITSYETIAVPSGTPIFTFNGTEAQFDACKNLITITNKTATGDTGKELTPYYYSREIRAEYEGMLTLKYWDDTTEQYVVKDSYPNFEKAFTAVEANKSNLIWINEDINVPYGKFTLPTAAQIGTGSLFIQGNNGSNKLTLNGVTSLSPRYGFELNNVELVLNDRYGTPNVTEFTISGSKGVEIESVTCGTKMNVSVGAGSGLTIWNCSTAKFGTLTGTTTSNLRIVSASITADKVTTFGTVQTPYSLTVTTSMTGVGELYGDGGVILHATATATITTLNHANITLLDDAADGLKLPKLTVTNVATASKFTVKDSTGTNTIAVPSGTPIFTFNGTEAQFEACKDKITIVNKTALDDTGNSLSPCYYNKEIRAEVPNVIKLYVEGEMDSSFTSFEKLFQYITTLANSDRTNQNDYVVVLCDSVTSKVFTLPTYGASFTVKSEGEEHNSLTLIGVTISYKNYPVHFDNVDLSVVKAA
ncbi:MAG: hypothetical protein J6O50_05870 [Ruminiclostridium sp.]|nr:hypothetical protein [Ruminiclostridium sp.]